MWLEGQIDWFVVLIAVWLCAVGGVIGSFLNVVVYRLPLGMSLVRPASRCPACLTPIRWYDNLPVIGWLWLRGRCRDCGEAISARYPLVEALVASYFVCLAASEFCFGGASDPVSAASRGFHAPWASDLSDTSVWLRYWSQILLGVTLLAAALIERDGAAASWRLFRPSLLISAALPFVWRAVRPLPFDYGWEQYARSAAGGWGQPLDGLLAAWVGLVFALVAWPLVGPNQRGSRPAMLALLAVGVALGWQLTAVLGATWLAWLIARAVGTDHARNGGLFALMVISWVVLLLWRPALALLLWLQQPAVTSLL